MPIGDVDRLRLKELGGGGLLDIGCYVISLACMVFGEMPESVTAVGNLLSTGEFIRSYSAQSLEITMVNKIHNQTIKIFYE